MTGKSTAELNSELDELAIQVLELMNENIACKMNIEKAVRSGCLDLAKTRYILGNTTSISALKFPTDEFTAISTVQSSIDKEGKRTYQLNRETVQAKVTEETHSVEPRIANQDPLKWFGVLVPQNLRQGQAWFQKAVDISVQGANIAADLQASQNRYNQLLKEKQLLKDKSEREL